MHIDDPVETRIPEDRTNAYIVLVLVLGYIWQIVIYFNGGVDSMLIPVTMFIPGILALVFRKKDGIGLREVGLRSGKLWYLAVSIFLPLTFSLVLAYGLETLGVATLTIFSMQDGLVISKAPLVLGTHPQEVLFFLFNLSLTFIPITVLGGIFTIGEEYGWRGYLQGKLIHKYGVKKGLILLGLIWGYWHLPIVLMGWTFPEQPILGAFILYPLSTVFLAIIMGWLYMRSKSIWTPVLFHAAFNSASGIIFSGMNFNQNELVIQLLWMALWGMTSLFCLKSLSDIDQISDSSYTFQGFIPNYSDE